MQGSMPRATFQRLLQIVATASAGATDVMPVFGHVRLEAKGETLEAAALSPDVAARASAPATVEQPGVVAVALRRCSDVVRHMAGERLTFRATDANLVLTGADGVARLPILGGEAPDDLVRPWQAEVPESAALLAVDAAAFRAALVSVRHAVSKDEHRTMLCGVGLEAGPGIVGLRLTATDGSRLARAGLAGTVDPPDRPLAVLLSPPAIEALATALDGLAGPVTIDADSTLCRLTAPGLGVRAVGLLAKLPDYLGAVERMGKPTAKAHVTPGALVPLLRRVLAVAAAVPSTVVSIGAKSLKLDSEDTEFGRADGALPVEQSEGEARVKVNPRFVLEALEAVGDRECLLMVLGTAPGDTHALELLTPDLRCIVVRMR